MAKSSAYSFKNVVAVIDGLRGNGFWEGDDTVEIEPVEDAGALTVGADGSSIFSAFADISHTITMRVQHTSNIHNLLLQKLAELRADTPRMDGFPVSVRDIRSGDGGSTEQAFVLTPPTKGFGKAASMREWVLVAGRWIDDITTPNAA